MSAWLQKLILLQAIPRQPGRVGTRALRHHLASRGFNVSLRTVQRNLNELAAALPELDNDGNRDATGWFWKADAPLIHLPALDPALALAFKLGENFLRPQLPEAVLAPLEPYFKAADAVLAASGEDNYRRWPDKVRFLPKGQALQSPRISPEVFTRVQTALFEGCQFTGIYQADKEPAEYQFNPLGLVYRGNVTYLVATLWDYPDPRHFALHRFQDAWLLETAAVTPEGFSLEAHIEEGHFDWPVGGDIKLVAYFYKDAARILAETPLSNDQVLEPCEDDEDWFELRATVQDTMQLRRWLLEWGDNISVFKPKKLKTFLSTTTANMANYYHNQQTK